MQVLIDHGSYGLANLGDLAMLQVAVKRIYQHFPDAKVYIFTSSPENFAKHFPSAVPVLPQLKKEWINNPFLPFPRRFLSDPWKNRLSYLEVTVKTKIPRIANFLIHLIDRQEQSEDRKNIDYFSIIQHSDMVIISGGGFITDYFKNHADAILDTLQLAQKLGKPTAMFGQGIGPLENQSLIRKAKRIFPKLKILGLREHFMSLNFGNYFNVPQDRIFVTGDDSIELATNQAANHEERKYIGLNIRQAYYAGNFQAVIPEIGRVIEVIANSHHVSIIPVPVQTNQANSDLSSIIEMCAIEEAEIKKAKQIKSPDDLIRQINRCRVVVTGSYHAAVFALALGIPVVALAGSDYYAAKFTGLADQFGLGCQIILFGSKNVLPELKEAIENNIRSQEGIESKLIEKAVQQVELSKNAWTKFFEMKK
jgi:polysaccharide pyruvyl transferase WcaK-like protein